MKTLLLAVASMVLLASTAAYADSCGSTTPMPPGGVAYQNGNDDWGNYQYSDVDHRRDNRKWGKHGGYELQTRSQWVPGGTTQVWVPGFCHRPPFSPIQVCAQGHYETRALPGHYEQVQEWVWVPHGGRFHGRHGRWR